MTLIAREIAVRVKRQATDPVRPLQAGPVQ